MAGNSVVEVYENRLMSLCVGTVGHNEKLNARCVLHVWNVVKGTYLADLNRSEPDQRPIDLDPEDVWVFYLEVLH